ncbi:MAG: alkaline phosphatase [Planctomycetia bacterium]|nr:alkaline phosphatase [Planctomycetia bacterium]
MHQQHKFVGFAAALTFAIAATFAPLAHSADDLLRQMQADAVATGKATWGHWGPVPDRYSSYTNHTNRLVPIYTFGAKLAPYQGTHVIYREPKLIERLYGQLPSGTLSPSADYLDETDVFYLQRAALEAGKKYIVLVIFDGLDWDTTRAAATYVNGRVAYDVGRGTGLAFQDYRKASPEFGYMVTSPYCDEAQTDVNAQTIIAAGSLRGGYDPRLGGAAPWLRPEDPTYLMGQHAIGQSRVHAFTDSAAGATSMTCGIKTYNDAINVDPRGRKYKTIAMYAQAKGYRVGAVTSVPISDATPAATMAHNVSRADYQDIARDLLGLPSVSHKTEPLSGLDVLVGAGWGAIRAASEEQGTNFAPGNPYLADADRRAVDVKNGGKYRVVERQSGINGTAALRQAADGAAAKGQRLLGFFGTTYGHLPYETADGRFDPAPSVGAPAERYLPADVSENPRLKDMTSAALTVLSAGDRPFWLMIEAGDVDWANHANNIDNSIGAIRSGDDAFRTVVEWIEKRNAWDDAAVIVTSDHGHYFVLTDPQAVAGARP